MNNRAALLRFLSARGAGENAEDLLQDMWVKVRAAAAPGSGPIAEPLAYLFRMADNLMLDRRRSAQRQLRRDDQWSDAATTLGGVSDQPSVERILLAREALRGIDGALDALGDRTASIFRRYRIDGVAQKDIAAGLGISLSAIEKHLQRAYRAISEYRRADAELPAARRHGIEGVDNDAG